MRQETIIKTYKYFNEFDDKTQDLIIKQYDRINEASWEFVAEDMIRDFTNELESMGYSDIKIGYSGFWSQGDGLSFTAKHGESEIYRINSRYSHSYTVTSDDKVLLESSRDLMYKYYSQLKKAYDSLFTKESIIETILANEYEFDTETLEIA